MPWQRTPHVTHHTLPHKYVTTTVTTERTASLNKFYAAYNEAPPNDYRFRVNVHDYTLSPTYTELVLEINIAASTMHEAISHVDKQLSSFLAADASYTITLISETIFTSHGTSRQVGE
jgi:hypothetical protein